MDARPALELVARLLAKHKLDAVLQVLKRTLRETRRP
jgi:hypothetical protein